MTRSILKAFSCFVVFRRFVDGAYDPSYYLAKASCSLQLQRTILRYGSRSVTFQICGEFAQEDSGVDTSSQTEATTTTTSTFSKSFQYDGTVAGVDEDAEETLPRGVPFGENSMMADAHHPAWLHLKAETSSSKCAFRVL